MKTANAAVLAFLPTAGGTSSFARVDLYTITLIGGTVLRYSGTDRPILINSNTFSLGPKIKRGQISESRGVQVASLNVTFYCETTDLVLGQAIIPFARNGGFDGAIVKLERAVGPTYDNLLGTAIRFMGRMGPVTNICQTGFDFTVNSSLELLNANVPPDVIQPICHHSLYDAGCTLNPASFAVSKTVLASPAPTTSSFSFTNTGPTYPDGRFSLGKVVFGTGVNNGLIRSIKTQVGGLVTLTLPLPAPPATGDAVTLYPGCDKLQATCSGTFSNLINFDGEPYVPVPETAL